MNYFVNQQSIVRQIWGKGDTVLFIFAGAAAEFALNKAVDWLYFTGRLPADPIGRLFSTVTYARRIVFAEMEKANKAIDQITAIHKNVEAERGGTIPAWAYRDVLFMLIYYSIASYELLERRLTEDEKEEVFNVFFRVGDRMGLVELPLNYKQWLQARDVHLQNDLAKSNYTIHLMQQYKKHLGTLRYYILLQVQAMLVPKSVKDLLSLQTPLIGTIFLTGYKGSRLVKADPFVKAILLPAKYQAQIKQLDQPEVA